MSVAKGARVPRFWGCADSVMIIGCLQSVKIQIDMDAAQEADVQMVRCSIGGGAMIMEHGNSITCSLTIEVAVALFIFTSIT